jgi:hypothetical protein
MTGDTAAATRLLRNLRDETRRLDGPDDPQVADLETQLALLPDDSRS